jgi:hypothetical protein
MKRLFVALVVGGMLFAGAWAAACALNVDAGVLQAGGDKVELCDDSGVQLYYRSDATPGIQWDDGFMVDAVVVGGLDAGCDSSWLKVELTDCHGTGIAYGEMPPPLVRDPSNGNPIVFLVKSVPASEVCDAHVLIQD